MSRRPSVRIHADNAYFGGSDALIALLAADPALAEAFELSVQFRDSERYAAMLAERLPASVETIPLPILDVPTWGLRFPSGVRPVAKAYSHLIGLKHRLLGDDIALCQAEFERSRPALVHVQNGGYPGAYSCLAASIAAHELGIPVIHVVNNIAKGRDEWRRRGEGVLDARVAAAVDVWVTGSAFAGRALEGVLGLDEGTVRTIPNGIRPLAAAERPGAVRKRLGLDPHELLAVTVATLEPRKGHVHLLRALAEPQLRDAHVVLAIEGEGSERAHLEVEAVGLGIADRVRFLGRIPEVVSLMGAADLFILPSVGAEDFPNVILEAMQLGVPVVGTRVAGIPEQIVDGVTGFVVEPADVAGLAAAVATWAGDADMRVAQSRAARERFESHFTGARVALDYAALYRELLIS